MIGIIIEGAIALFIVTVALSLGICILAGIGEFIAEIIEDWRGKSY